MKAALWILGVLLLLGATVYAAQALSPWPAALFYRVLMDRGGDGLSRALARHVPSGVTAILDQRYADDADALLDVYHPAQGSGALATVVWIHGGGFFAGSKRQVGNYLRILASHGFTTVGVEYSIAPGATYPTPVRQANAALDYLVHNGKRLRVDPRRLFLAGDSAGAQIAAQLANVISVPSYAKAVGITPAVSRAQLKGVVLYCGPYEAGLSKGGGLYSHFVNTSVWAYSGVRDAEKRRLSPEFSVGRFVTPAFPPAFISAGNGDPLLAHSRLLAEALVKQGVKVDTLFFPDDQQPPLPHEYQFNLDHEAGRLALERSVKFLSATR
jgi:acetyl esterase/lipase